MQYQGERRPALALSFFLALSKAARRTPSAEEQKKLLEDHDNRCAICAGIFDGDLKWDISPRPSPLGFAPHEAKEDEELFELDVRRHRRNALAYSAHDFAVFCRYDRIVRAEVGKLSDFSFVKLPPAGRGHCPCRLMSVPGGTTKWLSNSSSRMALLPGKISFFGPSKHRRI